MWAPYVMNFCNVLTVAWFQSRRLNSGADGACPNGRGALWHGWEDLVGFFFASAQLHGMDAARCNRNSRFAFEKPQYRRME